MNISNKIKIGVIADDFTGAGDAASFLAKNGYKTILVNNISNKFNFDCECVVIALKSRSVDPAEAIKQTKRAVDYLKNTNVEQIYFKYCSTFDSTSKGNIGPVLDFLMEYLNIPYTILCPSLPINGRTIKEGILYVDGIKLSQSSMKNHPLNPMWSSYIPTLMKDQSKYPCFIVSRKDMNNEYIHKKNDEYSKINNKYYLVPDYESDADGIAIIDLFKKLPLLSGGSGLLQHTLPQKISTSYIETKSKFINKTIILCGSCSKMTKRQVDKYKKNGGLCFGVDSKQLLNESLSANDIFNTICSHESTLIYSDVIDKGLSILRSTTFEREAKLMETLMSDLSVMARDQGFNKIIVAGGETSGAVAIKLGYDSYYIGKVIAPGIPTLIPIKNRGLNLILKSGNFGDEDFFEKAMEK